MIRSDKLNHALYSLHLILIKARQMAYNKEPFQKMAILLDYAELLPGFIASREDMTEEFKKYLAAIVESDPSCLFILERFDQPTVPEKW